MSNYCAVIYSTSEAPRIKGWLKAHPPGADIHTQSLRWNRTLLIISAQADKSVRANTYFRGTAFNAEHNSIVFGIDGWLDAPSAMRDNPGDHDGEYCCITWDKNRANVDRDVFGNARLLTTSGPSFVATSDSLSTLASLRNALRQPLSLNSEVMLARATFNNTAAQQMSPDTMFNEIFCVPAGFGVTLTTEMTAEHTGQPMSQRLTSMDGTDYREQVRQCAQQICQTVAGLASVPGWTSELSLSGGYDSRVVFGAARATGSFGPFAYSSTNSSPSHARDFEVATALAGRFGIPQHRASEFVPNTAPEDAMTLWAASLMGVYDGFGPSRTTQSFARSFTVTGIGAELLKGNWGWSPWSTLVKGFEPGIVRDAYDAQGQFGIRSIGGDPEHSFASETYYVGYRNGIHASAGHVGIHMTGMHPLQQFALARLGHTRSTGDDRARTPAAIADISILIDPAVATFEYDEAGRNISTQVAAERLRALGGSINADTLEPLQVYGDPASVPAGPSAVSMSIARSIGATGRFEKDVVLGFARDGLDALPTQLREVYASVYANAEWKIGKMNGQVRSAGASSARATSLLALRFL